MIIRSFFCLSLLLILPALSQAQQAMEMYIPIGASIGVSNTGSVIGKVASVDEQHKSFTVKDASETVTITVPDKTVIWMDRSKAGGTNQSGSVADIKEGLTVEVKFQEAKRGPSLTAEWIKVGGPN